MRQSISAIEPSTYLLRRRALFPDERHDALAIGGRFDTVVPPYSFHQLVDALTDPTVVTLNTGHYGGIFVEKRLLSEVANYFSSWNTKTTYEAPKDIQEVTFRLTAQAVAPTGFDIGVGVDVFRTHANYEAFGTVVMTPKGLELFVAQSIGGGLAAGGLVGTNGFGFGLFWSSIL